MACYLSLQREGARALVPQSDAVATVKKTKMKLYNADWCWYCTRVRRKLDELGLGYEIVEVPVRHSERREVIAVSGQPSVPVLVDGSTVLDDDDLIIPYLEKTYGMKR